MALATQQDVEARLGRPLTESEQERAEGLLTEASEIVLGYCNVDEFDPIPDSVVIVVSRMVARVLTAPEGIEGVESHQVGTGPFQQTRRFTSDVGTGGPWLTKMDKLMLRRWGRSMVSVPLGSERTP